MNITLTVTPTSATLFTHKMLTVGLESSDIRVLHSQDGDANQSQFQSVDDCGGLDL